MTQTIVKLVWTIMLGMTKSWAIPKTLLVHPPNVSPSHFQLFLDENRQYISYAYYQFKKKVTDPYRLDETLRFTLAVILRKKNVSMEECTYLKEFASGSQLSSTEVDYIFEFLTKFKLIHRLPPCLLSIEKYIDPIRYLVAKDSSIDESTEPPPTSSFSKALSHLSQYYTVALVNGVPISIQKIGLAPFSKGNKSESSYHWIFFSNSHESFTFHGSLSQLLTSEVHSQKFVDGNCKAFSINTNDLDLRLSGSIYFYGNCLKSIQAKDQDSLSFFQKNKIWIIPGGILVGALAYYLRDHRIHIQLHGLSF